MGQILAVDEWMHQNAWRHRFLFRSVMRHCVAAAFLIASDHSPVGLGLECFPLDAAYVLPDVTSNTSPTKKAVLPGGTKGMQTCETISNTMFLDG